MVFLCEHTHTHTPNITQGSPDIHVFHVVQWGFLQMGLLPFGLLWIPKRVSENQDVMLRNTETGYFKNQIITKIPKFMQMQ